MSGKLYMRSKYMRGNKNRRISYMKEEKGHGNGRGRRKKIANFYL